ncbi:FAD:protein FMN transferase [Shimwellia pseudoproteus]|uniref:FAD:protein FMN transferase n=1 Tax=Shimwellia pseudoproteus TaxID=570012 RepID=UPI0018EBDCB0|nr:FAD:protein FMN transferase [Shimwellia pseudoproteus]MBJ3813580.1 FAD:protein FMN transferase [Shimwellia pseudoproteus]
MASADGVYNYSAVLMGSPIQLRLFEHNEALAGAVFRLIKQYENRFTVNREPSEVMAVNRAAGQHPVAVSPPVYQLIRCAKAASLLPGSAFNLAIGPLVKRWKIGFHGDAVPPADEIRQLLTLTRPERVILDDAASTVFLADAGMEIDLGAIAKGYIADRVRDYLRREGVTAGLINLGGNVHTLGAPDGGWTVGLKKPFAGRDALIGTLTVADKSVVTSGIYERYFEQDGHCYHHILDPRSGYPLDNELLSVTIISRDSLDGDIWTTLLYGMGVTAGCAALRQREDIEAIFVTRHHEVICSSRRQFQFTLLDDQYRITDNIA